MIGDHGWVPMPAAKLSDERIAAKLREARVARLATVNAEGEPHIVPVCFACDGLAFYSALDLKPKRVPPERLARLRHITANPKVALLVDHYDDDWERLWFIMVRGTAALLPPDAVAELDAAREMLQAKYPQYSGAPNESFPPPGLVPLSLLPEDAPIIRIVPVKITSWGKL